MHRRMTREQMQTESRRRERAAQRIRQGWLKAMTEPSVRWSTEDWTPATRLIALRCDTAPLSVPPPGALP